MQTPETLRALGIDPDARLRPFLRLRQGRKPSSFVQDLRALGLDPAAPSPWHRYRTMASGEPQRDAHGDPICSPPTGIWGRDQFWLARAPAETGRDAHSPLWEPAAAYNLSRAQDLRVTLVHASLSDAIHAGHAAFVLPKIPRAPGERRFACQSEPNLDPDGHLYARRILGNGTVTRLRCPGMGDAHTPRCPYTSSESGPPPCTLRALLHVQLAEPEMPAVRIEADASGPWNFAIRQWTALAADLAQQQAHLARQLPGLVSGPPDLYGLPMRLTLRERTAPGSRFWVPELSTDFPPGQTVQGWLTAKAARIQQVRPAVAVSPTALIAADLPAPPPSRGGPK